LLSTISYHSGNSLKKPLSVGIIFLKEKEILKCYHFSSGITMPAIAGGVVAAVLVIVIAIAIAFLWRRKMAQRLKYNSFLLVNRT